MRKTPHGHRSPSVIGTDSHPLSGSTARPAATGPGARPGRTRIPARARPEVGKGLAPRGSHQAGSDVERLHGPSVRSTTAGHPRATSRGRRVETGLTRSDDLRCTLGNPAWRTGDGVPYQGRRSLASEAGAPSARTIESGSSAYPGTESFLRIGDCRLTLQSQCPTSQGSSWCGHVRPSVRSHDLRRRRPRRTSSHRRGARWAGTTPGGKPRDRAGDHGRTDGAGGRVSLVGVLRRWRWPRGRRARRPPSSAVASRRRPRRCP